MNHFSLKSALTEIRNNLWYKIHIIRTVILQLIIINDIQCFFLSDSVSLSSMSVSSSDLSASRMVAVASKSPKSIPAKYST